MLIDQVLLSVKSLKTRGIRSWLTMLGIFIGIAAVVSLISLGNGLQTAITGQFANIDPDKLIFSNADTGFGPPGSTAVRKLNQDDFDLLEKINGVDVVAQRLVRVVEIEFNDISDFSYIANLPDDQDQIDLIYDALNVKTEEGRLLTKNDRKKVILGNDFKDDRFGKPLKLGRKISIQGEDFEIVGFLERASTFTINSVVIMPDDDMRRILELGDEFDILVVQVKDINEAGVVANRIEDAFRAERNLDPGEEDFSIETPEQSLQTMLVGGIGITNTMYTSILERRKEIGVMKAVGARNRDILTIFLAESALLGFAGGVVGAAIGLGLAYLAAYGVTTVFPGLNFGVAVSVPLISLAVGFSLVIGTVSGIFPALQAARLQPVDALRA
jgi:putative ABC transport system permease protein